MNTIFKNSNVPRDFNLFIFFKMSYNLKVEKLANIKKFEFQTFHVALQVTRFNSICFVNIMSTINYKEKCI